MQAETAARDVGETACQAIEGGEDSWGLMDGRLGLDPVDAGQELQDLESEGCLFNLAEVCSVDHEVATRM